ncbi:hypothetical protein VNO78_10080 [Psophocarpus tetragonolobus]|uniref:Uncharacterized protein n=1 Tax=Psophocarpus tetragonolobus TaxID=3891 RepID=A0AAN9XM75_PSOTE
MFVKGFELFANGHYFFGHSGDLVKSLTFCVDIYYGFLLSIISSGIKAEVQYAMDSVKPNSGFIHALWGHSKQLMSAVATIEHCK